MGVPTSVLVNEIVGGGPPPAAGGSSLAGLGVVRTTVGPLDTSIVIGPPPPGKVRFVNTVTNDPSQGPVGMWLRTADGINNAAFNAYFDGAFGTLFLTTGASTGLYGPSPLQLPALIEGETFSIQNLDSTYAIDVVVTFVERDLDEEGLVPFRVATNGTTPVDIVPAPPTDKAHQLASAPAMPGDGGYPCTAWYFNLDTIAHGFQVRSNDAIMDNYPTGAIPDGLPTFFGSSAYTLREGITSVDFALAEATATTESLVVGLYRVIDSPWPAIP